MKYHVLIVLTCLALINVARVEAQTPAPETDTPASAEVTADPSDDWDWSGFEAMDDTPKTSRGTIKKTTATASKRLSIDEVTAPDTEIKPHQVYALFPGMPSFEVIPSKKDAEMHPCSSCHEWQESKKTPRILKQPHDNFALRHGLHGKGQFWCFTCHDMNDNGILKTLEGEYVNFEDAYILCSQCHVNEARDWAYGAHGKRVGNWQGKRQVYNCTVCHYQHNPSHQYRDALPGPEMRTGLQRPEHWVPKSQRESIVMHPTKPWEKHDQSGAAHE